MIHAETRRRGEGAAFGGMIRTKAQRHEDVPLAVTPLLDGQLAAGGKERVNSGFAAGPFLFVSSCLRARILLLRVSASLREPYLRGA